MKMEKNFRNLRIHGTRMAVFNCPTGSHLSRGPPFASAQGKRITIHESRHYSFDARNWTKSRQRLEYPHSLSYQANIFAQFVPTTRV
jgi:hypothetical protein